MENKRTYYHLILDRSGSMTSCIEQTIDGVNQQIKRIREIEERYPEQEFYTSLTLFNHQITPVWRRVRSANLKEISFSDYIPDGFTALYDVVGFTLNELLNEIGEEVDNNKATVVVVMVTDGYENSSKYFSHGQIAERIQQLEATGKWTFSYLGATLDAVQIAVNLNIKRENSMFFNVKESVEMYNLVSSSLFNYVGKKQSGTVEKDFFPKPENDE